MTIDIHPHVAGFLADWKKNTEECDSPKKRATGPFIVEVTPSPRFLTVRINSILSVKRKSKKMSSLIAWLAKKADEHNVVLTLCAQPYGWDKDESPNKNKLKSIVERHGFEVKFEYPDKDGYEMIRWPIV